MRSSGRGKAPTSTAVESPSPAGNRRTVLGPWWLTAQLAVYVTGLAFVLSQLLGSKINSFLPYVAVGFLGYALLSGLVRSGANVFVGQAGVIKSTRQPLASLVLRTVMVELIQFGVPVRTNPARGGSESYDQRDSPARV